MPFVSLRHATSALPLLVFWVISLAMVGISGDFPVFDDWAYTRAVRHLLHEGRLHLDDQQAVLLLPQIAIGWVVTSVTGFSFVSLRLIGIGSAVVASAAVYMALRAAGADRTVAGVAALAISINPVAHVTAYTFSSDVPTTALGAMALAAYVHAVRTDSRAWLVAAIAIGITAVLNRQSALAIILGFAAGLLAPPTSVRRVTASAASVGAAWVVLALAEQLVLAQQGALPAVYARRAAEPAGMMGALLSPDMFRQVAWAFVRQLLYLGLFTLPAWLVSGIRATRLMVTVAAAIGAVLIVADRPLPLLGGILYADGLGPITIHGSVSSILSPAFWWVVTTCAVLGAAALVDTAVRALRDIWKKRSGHDPASRIQIACLVAIGTLTILHALVGPFDRHLLLVLPAALVLIAVTPNAFPPHSRALGALATVGILVAMGVFAIGATRDCLEWERARWHVLRALERGRVSPHTIDGGLDYNRFQSGRLGTPDPGATTHHVTFVQERPGDAVVCEERQAWLGPRARAICARPGPGPSVLR